ncbi:MAG: hypothetical protein F6K62_15740 [Sphaerospermopsis sp. SIO1G2]|nr:hypothetical protein [Sphaerospermopsis sp. SIO1G2]
MALTEQEQINLNVVEGFFNSFVNGTVSEYIDNNFDPEVEYNVVGTESDLFGTEREAILTHTGLYEGIDGVKYFFDVTDTERSVLSFDIYEVFVSGDSVAAFGSFRYSSDLETGGSGDIFETEWATQIQLRDGKFYRYTFMEDSYAVPAGYRHKFDGEGINYRRSFGDEVRDIVTGTNGDDVIDQSSNENQNFIFAYKGNDTVTGGAKDDTIYAGAGDDTVTGNGGSDLFAIGLDQGTVTINDFVQGEDILGLTQIPASFTDPIPELSFADLTFNDVNGNLEISVSATQTILAILVGAAGTALTEGDFHIFPTPPAVTQVAPVGTPGFPNGFYVKSDPFGDEAPANPSLDQDANVEVVNNFINALRTGEDPTQFLASDVKITVVGTESDLFGAEREAILPHTGLYEGLEGVLEFVEIAQKEGVFRNANIQEVYSNDYKVAAFGTFEAISPSSEDGSGDIFGSSLGARIWMSEENGNPVISQAFIYEDSGALALGLRLKGEDDPTLNWTREFGGKDQNFQTGTVADDNLTGLPSKPVDDGEPIPLRNRIFGYEGDDTITGNVDDDFLYGGPDNDRLDGLAGNDDIYGGADDDVLNGGEGDDNLYGNAGDDTVTGGAGEDIFVLKAGDGSDTITDYVDGTDQIGLLGELTFADLTITQDGANTIITSNAGELLATLEGVTATDLTEDDFTTRSDSGAVINPRRDLTEFTEFGFGPDYPIFDHPLVDAEPTPSELQGYSLEEQKHIQLLQEFFDAQADGSILTNASNFFTEDARFIAIRGGEERLGRGDENGPESIVSTTPTAYSNSLGGLPLIGLDFRTTDFANGIINTFPVKTVPRIGGYTTEANQLDTGAYTDDSVAHETKDLIPFSGNYVGGDGVQEFFTTFSNNFEIVSFITTTDEFADQKGEASPYPYGIIANDDNLAVYGEIEARNRFTGNTAKSPFRIDIEFEDGLDGKIQTYQFWIDPHSFAAAMREGGSYRGQYGLTVTPVVEFGPNPEDFRFPTVAELDPDRYVEHPVFGRQYDPYGYLIDENGNPTNDNRFQQDQVDERLFLPVYIQWGTGENDELSGFEDTTVYYDSRYPNDQLYGLQGDDTLIGLIGDDELYGGSGDDNLDGGAGKDWLYGHTGINTLTGGADADIFVLDDLFDIRTYTTTSTITDFSITEGDQIGLGGTLTFDQLTIVDGANGAEISLTDSGLATLGIVENVTAAELTADYFTEIRPDYQIGVTTPDDVIGDADENQSLVLGFFQSFFTGDIFTYIRDNFTEDARYIVIQSENNDYNADDAFSGERYRITPTTKEWTGIDGAQGFIYSLFQAVDVLGTRWPDQEAATNFYIEKIVPDSADPDNVAIFGRFLYRNNSTGILTDGPFAYNFHIKHVEDETTGELVAQIDTVSFFEQYNAFGYTSRQGGTWTRNYDGELTDIIWGTTSTDNLEGTERENIIYGYQSNDHVDGKDGDDTIYGGFGDDTITGGFGDDHIWGDGAAGSPGNDNPNSNPGSDTFILTTGAGTDKIYDFEVGQDQISLLDGLTFNQLTLTETAGDLEVKVTNTDEVLAILKGVNSLSSSDVISEPEDIVTGTPENDDLFAPIDLDGQRDIVFTGAGIDSIDVSVSTVGRNRIFGGSGGDTFYLSTRDRAFGGSGDDNFVALDGTGGNRMSGGAGNDTFDLGSGDRAVGGTGNDIFNVIEGGDNILAGGAGADNFWVASAQIPDAANTIVDFELGTDVIGIRGYVQDDITFGTDASGNAVLGVLASDVAIFQGITQAQLETATLAFG